MISQRIVTIVLILLSINSYPYTYVSHYKSSAGAYRVVAILNYLVTNRGENTTLFMITDFLSQYCFETIHEDQLVENINLYVNNNSVSLRIVDGCLSALNDEFVEIAPKNTVNVTLVIDVLIDLKHRSDELKRALQYLTSSSNSETHIDSSMEPAPTSIWNYTHPLLRLITKYIRGKTINGGNPVIEALEYVNRNIVYSVTFPSRYPWETLVAGSGDCDDQSNLIITILRGLGFNAYMELGIVPIVHGYTLNFSSSNRRLSYKYIGGFMHSWVSLKTGKNLTVRIDPVVVKPGSDPTLLITNAYFYVKPVLVFKNEIFDENYILKQYSSILEPSTSGLFFNITLSVHYSEAPVVS